LGIHIPDSKLKTKILNNFLNFFKKLREFDEIYLTERTFCANILDVKTGRFEKCNYYNLNRHHILVPIHILVPTCSEEAFYGLARKLDSTAV